MPDDSPSFKIPFEDFLAAAASRSHVPGGGSVAAAAGALGASMGAMVAHLTVGKEGYEVHQKEAQELAGAFLAGMEALQRLGEADMAAYDALASAYRLPKANPRERLSRGVAVRAAVRRAVLVPLEIAQTASELLELNARLASFGNDRAVNDCGVAAVLLEAAARGAMLTADVNLPRLDDPGMAEAVRARKEEVFTGARGIVKDTLAIVEERRR
ncbi:MAG: cyclodeaminase/cyclohydrolase family protein [Deltaproteobacteria bacterium]|jgi:formiminotetrahydrofolate cyclodeaminase|nr:cyclodeaminase/cyclohydrolase family protein [Deltaproteobacteria bacterium]